MTLVEEIKDKYVKEMIKELKKMRKEYKGKPANGRTDFIFRTGVVAGLEKAIELVEEYE